MLFYDPDGADSVEPIIDKVLQREPRSTVALTVRAFFLWWIRDDISAARAIIQKALTDFPKDQGLLSSALYLSLADNDLKQAAALLKKLTRQQGANSEQVLYYRGVMCICRGDSLGDAELAFHDAGGVEPAVDRAITLWAGERDDECRVLARSINPGSLSHEGRVQLEVVRLLVDLNANLAANQIPTHFASLGGQLRDVTILQALSIHDQVPEVRRTLLRTVLDTIAYHA